MFTMEKAMFKDQLGRQVELHVPPRRIVSLVPSQTELLADLGLNDCVVGITKFCVHPESWRKTKAIIGGTKQFDFTAIHALNPDLIIANKEENYQAGIAELSKHYPVWISDIVTLDDALDMITQVGSVTQTESKAHELVGSIRQSFQNLLKLQELKTLYLIWRNPWMAAASGTFIHEMIGLTGLKNSIADRSRYPELTSDEIRQLNPELIFLSSEPYPFKEKHIAELQKLCPAARILLVDGEMFSWYGSRLLKFPAYLQTLRNTLS